MTIRARWADLAEMTARAEEWRALAGRAAEPNVFADPDYVLPALRHLGAGGVRFLIAEREENGAPVLAGVLPLRLSRARWGVPLRVAVHYLPYAPHGVALVDDDDPDGICAALVEALAVGRGAPAALLLPTVNEDGGFARALKAALGRSGRRLERFDLFARAAMIPAMGEERTSYLVRRLSKRRRGRLDGQRKRLEAEGGRLATRIASGGEVAPALERFFAIEASGWKGRRGTAAGQAGALAAFFRESLNALAGRGQGEIIGLWQGDAPVAMGLLLRARDHVWFYKTAYEESLARFSPGVLLDLAATDHLLDDAGIAIGDSLATAPDPFFEQMWGERLPMADWLVEVTPGSGLRFGFAVRLEGWRRRGRLAAKAAVVRLRARFGRTG